MKWIELRDEKDRAMLIKLESIDAVKYREDEEKMVIFFDDFYAVTNNSYEEIVKILIEATAPCK